MKKIYNKNAREKALLEEAYSNVYKETDEETLTEAVPLAAAAMAAPAAIPVAKKVLQHSPMVQGAKSLMGSDEEVSDISGERWSEEWDFDNFTPQLNQAIEEFENHLANLEDASVFDLKDIVDEIVAANVLDDDVKEQAIGYLKQKAEAAGLEEFELYGEEGIFS